MFQTAGNQLGIQNFHRDPFSYFWPVLTQSSFCLERLRMTLIQSCLRLRRDWLGIRRGMMARNGYLAKNIFLKHTCRTYIGSKEGERKSPGILQRVRDTPFSRVLSGCDENRPIPTTLRLVVLGCTASQVFLYTSPRDEIESRQPFAGT